MLEVLYTQVSIHAPRVGRDPPRKKEQSGVDVFQSTRPVWGATVADAAKAKAEYVSIHAPRVGRDALAAAVGSVGLVSIHAPRVGRDCSLLRFS